MWWLFLIDLHGLHRSDACPYRKVGLKGYMILCPSFLCRVGILLTRNERLKSCYTPLLAGSLNLDFLDILPDGVPMHPLAKYMREQCWRAPAHLVEPSDVCTASCNSVSRIEGDNSLCATGVLFSYCMSGYREGEAAAMGLVHPEQRFLSN